MEWLFIGIGIGIFYVVSLIVAFATGLGWNAKSNTDEEES